MQTFFSCTALEINAGLGLTSMCGRKKGEEFAELELRVVFVHWAQRKEERNSSVRESERAVKETTGLLDSHRDKHHHATSFPLPLLLLFSLFLHSVCLYVSVGCFRSMLALTVLTTVLSVLRYFNPIDSRRLVSALRYGPAF